VIASVASVASAQESAAMARLEQLKQSLGRHEVWQASYRQLFTPVGMTTAEEMAGQVWVALPDRAHFRAGDPPLQLMGLQGRAVRLIDLDVPSCDDHLLSDEDWARIPLAAVLDPEGAVEHFSILDLGDNGISLIPLEPGGVDRVEVILDSSGLPEQVVVVDPQGATNHLLFSGWHQSEPPPEDAWLPVPPSKLECVTAE
jgi:hypothetical protein